MTIARAAILFTILSAVVIALGLLPSSSPVRAEAGPVEAGFAPPEVAPTVPGNPDESGLLKRERLDTPISERLLSLFGIVVLVAISWAMSANRRAIKWRPVIWGIVLQIVFGLIVLSETAGAFFFTVVDRGVGRLLSFSEEGAAFVFGKLAYGPVDARGLGQGMFFFFSVLPTIVFFSSLMTLLYHLGVMEKIVMVIARVMQKTMKTSGSETLSAAANIFVGQTEAPLVVKPFIKHMTVSELHCVMVGGFATVAGGVMAAYVVFLRDFIPNIAGHLVTASIMSAPAAIAISKIVYPETEESMTAGSLKMAVEKPDANLIEAAARGATEGMALLLNVAAMLIAFVGLVAMVNYTLEKVSELASAAAGKSPFVVHVADPGLERVRAGDTLRIALTTKNLDYPITAVDVKERTLRIDRRLLETYAGQAYQVRRGEETVLMGKALSGSRGLFYVNLSIILGWIFAPISWAMGVPWSEARIVGKLLGEKLVLTEFIAYLNLADILKNGYETASGVVQHLSQRSAVIASYALCGFANFASIGIQIGGIGGIAPNRRAELARIGLRAMFAGAIAACLTGNIVGIFI